MSATVESQPALLEAVGKFRYAQNLAAAALQAADWANNPWLTTAERNTRKWVIPSANIAAVTRSAVSTS